MVENKLNAKHNGIINAGLIDSAEKAFEAGRLFRCEGVDIIFLYVTTYALSSTVLPVLQRAKVPVVILNLSPERSINYEIFNGLNDSAKMTGEWLAYCSACPVPELANVFKRTNIQFHQVTGTLNDDPECWSEIYEWIEAAKVVFTMSNNRLGCMGHYYSGMLDIYTDITQHYASFGGHVELLEVDELSALRKTVTDEQTAKRIELFHTQFEILETCSLEELRIAAKTSVALDQMVAKYNLGSMAYFYNGRDHDDNKETISSIILGNSLLTANHVPVAGEYDIKNAQAMKILDSFDAGGSFTEYYAMDYDADIVLMGHDGPGHIAITEGKTVVKPLKNYHGKIGKGLSVEMSVKNGPVTFLAVLEQGGGKLMLLVAEGESIAGPILEIGNTNSRYRFGIGARRFVNNWNSHGPSHHCAVGVGHIASKIKKLGQLLNLEVIQVC